MWLEEVLRVFTRLRAIKTSVAKSFCEHLGTVHFLRGRGGWWDLGGHPKKTASKGGPSEKNKGKGGLT